LKNKNLQLINRTFTAFFFIISLAIFTPKSFASSEGSETFQPGEMIIHDVLDNHIWHFWDGPFGTLYLPVILYSGEKGLEIFSSSNFFDKDHKAISYNGYVKENTHIYLDGSETKVWDFSITKNVAFLFLNSGLLIFVFLSVARGYKKNEGGPPRGIQSFFEPIIIFIRDDVVKPNIGEGYEKYLPYLLTLFFFIWFGNILGLVPGAANLTGNIAVTFVLAMFTFILTTISGNKNYWGHIFNTPGVPLALKPIIVPVEIIGLFTKPISLMIRLFVAITAGHIVILSLISLSFVFGSFYVGLGSSLMVIFINLIEILVATIQAYVFTMFTSLYIGMAVEKHH
jgi:F-type H+-transporting ATPase subunit a